MTPERWQQIDQLLDAALQRNAEERGLFLTDVCAGDESLRREVESLLAAHNRAATFIEASPPVAAEVITDDQAKGMIGRTLGHYQIRALLGAGGMGIEASGRDRPTEEPHGGTPFLRRTVGRRDGRSVEGLAAYGYPRLELCPRVAAVGTAQEMP